MSLVKNIWRIPQSSRTIPGFFKDVKIHRTISSCWYGTLYDCAITALFNGSPGSCLQYCILQHTFPNLISCRFLTLSKILNRSCSVVTHYTYDLLKKLNIVNIASYKCCANSFQYHSVVKSAACLGFLPCRQFFDQYYFLNLLQALSYHYIFTISIARYKIDPRQLCEGFLVPAICYASL